MPNQAYATEIKPENYQAILSEAGRNFNADFLHRWVAENQEGFFIRDERSSLDCALMKSVDFAQVYMFYRGDVGVLFRTVVKK